MESKNNIDKLFKDKLSNREFDIKERFLADLEVKLDAQKPKNKLWRIFYIVGIVIILGSLSYFYRTIDDTSSKYYFPISLNDSYQKTDVLNDGLVDEEVVAIDKIGTEATSKINGSNSVDQLDLNNSQSSQKNRGNEQRALEPNISDDKNKSDKEENNKHLSSINKNVTTNSTVNNPANSIKDQINSNNTKASNGETEMVIEKNEPISLTKENLTETENETLLPVGLGTEDTNSTSVVLNDNDKEVVASNKESIEDSISIKENTSTELIASKNSGLIDKEITQIVSDTAVPDILTNENQNTTGDLDTNTTEKEIIDDNDAVTNEEITDTTILAVDSIVVDSLALEKEISEEFSDTLSKDDSLANKEGLTPEDANETFKKWTFSVFGGPSLINKKIAGGSTDAYLVKRNDEEANIVSMSYGLRMNYNFNEKINFSLGANSLTYGEDVNYSTIYSTSESIGSVSKDSSYLEYTYTAVPDTINGGYDTTVTIAMIDTTFMVDTTIININATDYAGKNRFTYLQIPIMVGYKFTFNKLSVNVRLGGSYGVLLKNSGSYVDNNVSNIELPNLRKTMINLVASATIGYQLKKMNVFIEPKFRLNSGSIITHPEIKQRYTSIGCNFGLSFDF
jgi:hypothetical protein